MGDRSYSFDANLLLADGAAAQTASGYAQVGGADGILDLGGNQGVTPKQQARIDAVLVGMISAIDISSGNETYKLKMLGCNAANFAANVQCLASLELGKGASLVPATQVDAAPGMFELPFSTEQFNTKYEYVKLYLELGGTSPSIQLQAYVAVLPEP